MTVDDFRPMTMEYQGHRIVRGWHVTGQSRRTVRMAFGNEWGCRGPEAEQSRWCPFCCERNGWTWANPNSQYAGAPR